MLSVAPWSRASLTALVVLGLATSGHAFAGGTVALLPLLAAAGATLVAVRLLQGRPGRFAPVAALLVGGQVLFHAVGHPAHIGMSHPAMTVSGHDHVVGLRRSVAPAAPAVVAWLGELLQSLLQHPPMAAAHAVAALLAAAWLVTGERATLTLLGILGTRLNTRLAHPCVVAVPPVVPPRHARVLTPISVHLARIGRRRGPPPRWALLATPV